MSYWQMVYRKFDDLVILEGRKGEIKIFGWNDILVDLLELNKYKGEDKEAIEILKLSDGNEELLDIAIELFNKEEINIEYGNIKIKKKDKKYTIFKKADKFREYDSIVNVIQKMIEVKDIAR